MSRSVTPARLAVASTRSAVSAQRVDSVADVQAESCRGEQGMVVFGVADSQWVGAGHAEFDKSFVQAGAFGDAGRHQHQGVTVRTRWTSSPGPRRRPARRDGRHRWPAAPGRSAPRRRPPVAAPAGPDRPGRRGSGSSRRRGARSRSPRPPMSNRSASLEDFTSRSTGIRPVASSICTPSARRAANRVQHGWLGRRWLIVPSRSSATVRYQPTSQLRSGTARCQGHSCGPRITTTGQVA